MDRDKRQLEEQPFEYAPPLEFSEHEVTWIRLALLLPAKKFDDLLYCTLTYVPSSDLGRLQYEALSYAWGEQNDMQSLYCRNDSSSQHDSREGPVRDGWGDLKITANLDRALRHLRLKKKHRRLFVDAVCINQQDTAEKEEQIALLPQIYGQCSRTIVWIGEPDYQTAFIFKTLAALDRLERVLRRVPTLNSVKTLQRCFRYRKFFHRFGFALLRLIDRPWFHRLWTMQEVLLSPVNFVCGSRTADLYVFWTALASTSYTFNFWSTEQDSERSERRMAGRFEAIGQYFRAKTMEADHHLERRAATLTLLVELKQLIASNPKDKVVGTAALAESLDMPLPKLSYSLSEAQIFSAATRFWMKHLHCIDCLGLAVMPRNRPDLPSWAVDWSSPTWRDYGYLKSIFPTTDRRQPKTRWLEHHSATQGAVYSLHSAEGDFDLKLRLCGVLLPDTVEQVHIPKLLGEPPDALTIREIGSRSNEYRFFVASTVDWLLFLHGLNVKGENASTRLHDLAPMFLVLAGLTDSIDLDRAATALESIVPWAVEVRPLFAERPGQRFQDFATEELHRRVHVSGPHTNWYMAFGIVRAAAYQMCSLFSTSSGLVGLCWGLTLKPGCRVALVAGWDFPIILGPTETEGEYTFCGPAYIHSLMDGHAWPRDQGDLQDIVLV